MLALVLEGLTTAALLKMLLGAGLTVGGGGLLLNNFLSTRKEQDRADKLANRQLDILLKQITAETEGKERAFERSEEQTDRFLGEIRQEKRKDRSERRLARSDALKAQNQNAQLALIATLLQGFQTQGQQQVQAQTTLAPTPPVSMVNIMRGLR